MARLKAKVKTDKLAFWESLIDLGDKPTRYINKGEIITITDDTEIYPTLFADKAYVKVAHNTYGMGYMRKDGLEVQNETKPADT